MIHEICIMQNEGGTWKIYQYSNKGLAETIRWAEEMMRGFDSYAVGIRLKEEGEFRYLNVKGCGPTKTSKHKRLPKFSKKALPMEGNPIA